MVAGLLDACLLVTILVCPWLLTIAALFPLRQIIKQDRWWLVGLGVGLWLMLTSFFSPLSQTLIQAMNDATTKPWLAAYIHGVSSGHAPLWSTHLGTGLPALADPYVGYMSPFTSLLLLFRDLDQGVNVVIIAHLVFAALSSFILTRSLHLSRLAAVTCALVYIFNPWVFGKLEIGIQAFYLFGYAWIPLTWTFVLWFIETGRFFDGLRLGIPLAFMAISIPTVFSQMIFAVVMMIILMIIHQLWKRQWGKAVRLSLGIAAMILGTFAAAAPEHLAGYELLSLNENTRFGLARMGGWRDHDLATTEFLRVLFPDWLGDRLFSNAKLTSSFGIPFSPGDISVILAIVGVFFVSKNLERRGRFHPLAHFTLFLIVASITTHGLFYEPVMRGYALWATTGNFPVVGALLLITMLPFIGAGMESLKRFIMRGWSRYGKRSVSVSAIISVVLISLYLVELFWGFERIIAVMRGQEELYRRYSIPVMALAEIYRQPHLEWLRERAEEVGHPLRIYCTADRGLWPSPCFDSIVDRYKLELVGVGELGWAMPKWQWRLFTDLWSQWQGPFSPLFERVLRLAGVEYIVATRPLDWPTAAIVIWKPYPGNAQLWGRLLKDSMGGGPWAGEWDKLIHIHAIPEPYPRVFFAEAARLDGTYEEQDQTVRSLLSQADINPRAVAFIHTDPNIEFPAERRSEAWLHNRSASKTKLEFESPAGGMWQARGTMPRAGALIFSQMYYPGMKAWVNGKRVPVARANLFVTAIPVPAGNINVSLRYAPYGIMAASFITLAFIGLLTWRTRYEIRAHRLQLSAN